MCLACSYLKIELRMSDYSRLIKRLFLLSKPWHDTKLLFEAVHPDVKQEVKDVRIYRKTFSNESAAICR